MTHKTENPIIDEVRERAAKISKRYGHDPRKYLKHLKAAQKANASRLVRQMTVVS